MQGQRQVHFFTNLYVGDFCAESMVESATPFALRGSDHLRGEQIEDHVHLTGHDIGLVGGSDTFDLIRVVEQGRRGTLFVHARVHARRRLTRLDPRVAEDALLGLAVLQL